jgi:glutathione S-transferase
MSIVFYAAPQSSALPVACALAELAVPHERIPVNLAAKEQRRPEFLKLNPNGKVPTLVVDGTPMFEALAILLWLGDRYGVAKGLWPAAESPERLTALSWSTWPYASFTAKLQILTYASSDYVPPELHNAALAERQREELQGMLGLLDQRLAERPHMLGEAYSLVDLTVANVVKYGTLVGGSVDSHPHLRSWLERCMARPAISEEWAKKS